MSAEVDEALRNALNAEIKQRFGENRFLNSVVIIALVERPREPEEGPEALVVQQMIKTLGPVQARAAMKMLAVAAVQFQKATNDAGGTE